MMLHCLAPKGASGNDERLQEIGSLLYGAPALTEETV